MNFVEYRDAIKELQYLASNYTRLSKSDLQRMTLLNEKCLSLKENAVRSFSQMVKKVEDGLTGLIDRFDQLKNELDTITGPEGTLEDALKLEQAWLQTNDLYNSIQLLTEKNDTSTEVPGQVDRPENTKPEGIQDIVVARKEVAAAIEKIAPTLKSTPPGGKSTPVNTVKTHDIKQGTKKSAQSKKGIKPVSGVYSAKPLPVSKVCGEAEQRLMEEINKNIELIKSKKK